ncbi:MAG: DNA polymerase III subunit beta [Candidatus Omnitrophota bacterium]
MRVEISKEDLLKGIQVIQNVINPRSTLPILSNILMETQKENSLKLISTDLDIGIATILPIEVQEAGSITVPAKKFADIIKELPDDIVNIAVKKNNIVNITSRTCQFKLMGLPKEEFPKLADFQDQHPIELEQGVIKEMLELVYFAASTDETRYVLNGILMEIKDKVLKFVATDGRRLAIVKRNLATVFPKDTSVIIPVKTAQELNRNLGEEGLLQFFLGENQVLFKMGATSITSRLIEGEFPDYNSVIPQPVDNKVKLNRQGFLLALRRASLLSTLDYQAVKLELFKNKMVISKSTPDLGESREELDVEYAGKELIIGFNPYYIMDVLKSLASEIVAFEITDSDKPGAIRSQDYIYIVLPMRI